LLLTVLLPPPPPPLFPYTTLFRSTPPRRLFAYNALSGFRFLQGIESLVVGELEVADVNPKPGANAGDNGHDGNVVARHDGHAERSEEHTSETPVTWPARMPSPA